jgi:hypothetical protein
MLKHWNLGFIERAQFNVMYFYSEYTEESLVDIVFTVNST